MPFVHSIELAREERIGRHGVSAAALNDALSRSEEALAFLCARHADGGLPLLRYPERTDDLAAIKDAAARIGDGATDVIFLGTGGSSLGGHALAQLAGYGVSGVGAWRAAPRLYFMDNLDPGSFAAMLDKLPMATSHFVAVSKSGGTGETLMQTIVVLSALKAAKLGIAKHVTGISEPAKPGKANGLRDLLTRHGAPMMDHDPGIGGRYSVLTNVGLLPAVLCGLDIAAIRKGAAAALAPVLANKPAAEVPSAVGAALAVVQANNGKSISPIMAYADRLRQFTRWYVQLWAESIGKQGKGTTPLSALGPVDQHSQLQLFIDGPPDKLFTIITTDVAGTGPRIDPDLAKLAGEPGLGGKTIGDLVAVQGRATVETLAKNGRPVRTIHVPKLDEAALGELMMHFMLETIIAARLIGVDPFDQPAVEQGKLLAKRYLASS